MHTCSGPKYVEIIIVCEFVYRIVFLRQVRHGEVGREEDSHLTAERVERPSTLHKDDQHDMVPL